MKPCDIIIPIYNAYDCLENCIETVVEYTNLSYNNLILINDHSTDSRVLPYLKTVIEKYSNLNIFLLENEENLGFVSTVNKGMKFSNNNVLLLNSDTEVCDHWLDEINKCFESEPDVATVTPLSNNATLVSSPMGLRANEIPEGYSFQEYAKIVSRISYRDYPQLPTAHGFCMFISRYALDNVGFFDEETFGRGYGEENDFSFRCLNFGFKHLLCDSTLIYHKESQSFNNERIERIKYSEKILHEKYPVYSKKVEFWCENYPISYINKNIFYNVHMKERVNILFLIHDWEDIENNIGGTTLHVYDLVKGLKSKYNFHVLTLEKGTYKIYSYFENAESVLEIGGIETCNSKSFYNKEYKDIVTKVLKGLNISILHIHHMIGHYFDIIDVAEMFEIKTIITLHDFYSLCPTINMLYNMQSFCINLENKNCKECLKNKMNIQDNIIPVWQESWYKFLMKFDSVIVPSESTKKIIESVYSDLNCIVNEHGIDLKRTATIPHANKGSFNVAFIGVMAIHKGADVIKDVINNSSSKDIKFHLFGWSELPFFLKNKKNYIYHGKYERDSLPELLKENHIDLVCNLSICAETYSYTLTETIACGIPVLSYDIGAVGERIKKYNLGWIMPVKDRGYRSLLEKIISISNDCEEYNCRLNSIDNYKIKNVNEMLTEYEFIYFNNKISGSELESKIDELELKSLIKFSYLKKKSTDISELDRILNSAKWRIVSKIKIPQRIKRIIKRFIN